jgi:diguanylate cyclase (GGDEF)-like protein
MEPLVRVSLGVRRAARHAFGPLVALALGAWVVLGGTMGPRGMGAAIFCLVLVVRLVPAIGRKLRRPEDAPLSLDLELGFLLTVALEAVLLHVDKSLDGPCAPALYLLVALLAALLRPGAATIVVVMALGLEAAIRTLLLESALGPMIPRVLLCATFAAANALLLRAEVARVRRAARARIEEELMRLQEDARSYRLLGGEAQDERAEDRLSRSSVEEIQKAVHYALDLLRRTLDLHTAVLLWLNEAGSHLRISELTTQSDDINDAPFSIGDGVLAAAALRKERVVLANLRPSYKVPYYAGPCPVRALLAIPVLEDGKLRGILAVDRVQNTPFSPHEEELVAQAARFCLRAIQNERVFLQLERAKVEQGKLYRAARSLGAALSEKDVLDAGVRAAREIASFDLAAVTTWDESSRQHQVVAAASASDVGVGDLVGARFAHNQGLVSMVVQNKFPLPYKGEYDATRQVVLTKHYPWPSVASLLVLPLVLHDRALGTLILGAKRARAFGDAVRPTLEVLASHLAVSLANARMVAKLEQMATTDGLTGLLNKRALLDATEQKVAAAARFGRKLSVLVTDIDHFKKVNDTYGHDVGDCVIKGLAEILKRNKRTTDVVARFGGEEFVAVCEQTDEKGAMLLAERIREELGRTTFHTEKGPLKVTCSIGIATFPESGVEWESLFKAADDALYVSKRSGRNRSTAHVPARHGASGPLTRRAG